MTTRRTARLISAVAAAVIAATLAAPAAQADRVTDSSDLPPVTAKDLNPVADYQRLNADLKRIAARAETAVDFAGVELVSGARKVVVHSTDAPAMKTRQEGVQRDSVALEVRQVEHTYAELLEAQEKVKADRPWRLAQDITISAFGPDLGSNTLRLGVVDLTDARRTAVQERYADLPISIEAEEPIHPASRIDDSSPWNGGLRIQPSQCTGGIPVQSNHSTVRYMITAAHCVDQGNAVSNFNTSMGSVAYSHEDAYGTDSALIYTPTSDLLFRAANTRGDMLPTIERDRVGQMVCTSGSYSLEVCAAQVVAIDICGEAEANANFPSAPCHVTVVQRNDGITVGQDGDSGGPTYAVYPNGLQARGMISYIYTTTENLTFGSSNCTWALGNPQDNRCSRKVAYVPMWLLQQHWAVHVYDN